MNCEPVSETSRPALQGNHLPNRHALGVIGYLCRIGPIRTCYLDLNPRHAPLRECNLHLIALPD
jgi:hypothetical protein